ncbi:MAG: hypothetical protein IJQ68_07020 [Methanobrevibacter sp.]|uniref:hypothetical protein n=1 Tax=Methanobrevibacter sp. TaxID=66852 RepID=UPI0025F1B382|nr:hypothetical protein [Methanobrevibacter sp.]MBR0271723.1 hypothetical protein [Methanobrevibacter sp.]
MKRKEFRLIFAILIILIFAFAVSYIILGTSNDTSLNHEIIANDTNGTVEVIRNIGNPDGDKIAYIVGVHPLENDTHKTFLNIMPTLNNLNYSYDIYIINVSEDFSKYSELLPDDEPGRQTGQELALKYVYPQIVNGSYKLAVDVHAHGGAYGEHDTFVFSPVDGSAGEIYGRNVSMNSQNISYYNPYFTTSGPYLTVPLTENGVPAFYFEENSFFPQDIKDSHMLELIRGVDHLKF